MPSTSARSVRIFVAVLIAGGFIGTAFYLTSSSSLFSSVTAQSTDELLESYAALDTDADGLPDWQEALYGTDPNNPESVEAGVLDADAVARGLVSPKFLSEESSAGGEITIPVDQAAANTLTDRFSRLFFSQYLAGRNAVAPTSEQIQQFVADATADVLSERAPDYLPVSLVVRGTDDTATGVAAYVSAVDAALIASGGQGGENELAYFDAAIKGDTEAADRMQSIAAVYRASAERMKAVLVPPSLVSAHAEATSAIYGLSIAVDDMAAYKADPLRAFVGIRKYKDYADSMSTSFAEIRTTVEARGVDLSGSFFGSLLLQSTTP